MDYYRQRTNAYFNLSGNVGIGATSPGAKLDIASSNNNIFQITALGSGYGGTSLASIYSERSVAGSNALLKVGSAYAPNTFIVQDSGNVGIGTSNPNGALEVNTPTTYFDTMPTFAAAINSQSSSSNTLVISNGGAVSRAAGINFHSTPTTDGRLFNSGNIKSGWTGSGYASTYLTLGSAATGTTYNDELTLTGGKVGIGTTTPDALLSVKGTIHSQEVKVDMLNWADYVFKPAYKLPSLSELKTYIDINQHLPDVPSEQDVIKNGVNLGEMNKLLLKKVEELTLYLIEKDKQLTHEQEANMAQQKQIDEMKSKLEILLKQNR